MELNKESFNMLESKHRIFALFLLMRRYPT